jgi:Undecaprenyl-phosphate glucose phosphotransferase
MSLKKQQDDLQKIDIAALRKKVAAERSNAPEGTQAEPVQLNSLARLVANQLARDSHSPAIVLGLIRAVEFTVLAAAAAILHLNLSFADTDTLTQTITLAISFAVFSSVLLHSSGAYELQILRWPSLVFARLQLILVVSTFFNAAIHVFFIGPLHFAWYEVLLVHLLITVIVMAARFALAKAIRLWGRNGFMERRAVIVGGGSAAKDVIRSLEQQGNDIRICGIFDDRDSARSPNVVAGYTKLGTFAELVEFARLTKLDMLIIALPTTAEARILQLLRKLWVLPVDIRIASHSSDLRFRPRAFSSTSEMPMLSVFDKPIRDWDSVAKRIFDIVFAIIAIALTWPIMLGAALAVKFNSKGPILFVQKRHGFNNDTINVLKFRSMYTDQADVTAKKAVTRHDPRVTPVGRFIRKTSIDELPQLFNVLRGDLSLVGPRPHAVHAQTGEIKYDVVVEHYFARHRVKPGVTGWAQINGLRGEIDHGDKIKNRTAFDLYYIENWSLWLDFKILVTTPISLIRSRNVY